MLENNVNNKEREPVIEIVFIIDKSGSMSGLESDTISGFNSMLKEQQAQPGAAVITTVFFNNNCFLLHDRIDVHAVAPITAKEYQVGGSTALLDAVGKTIKRLRKKQEPMVPELRGKALFFIITDSVENSSIKYSYDEVMNIIKHQKEKDMWDFIFIGANIDEISEAAKIGIDANRVIEFFSNRAGVFNSWSTISAFCTLFRSIFKSQYPSNKLRA